MAQHSTYLLTPNLGLRSHTGPTPISLGSLIADPLRPDQVLTAVDLGAVSLAARYPHVEQTIEHPFKRTMARAADEDVAISIWARFLRTARPCAEGEGYRSKSSCWCESMTNEYHTMESLVTEYFVDDPKQEEIEVRVAEPRVRGAMRARRQPVYMITGIKIAKGVVGKTGAIGDVVCAYQLLKIRFSRWGGRKQLVIEGFQPPKQDIVGTTLTTAKRMRSRMRSMILSLRWRVWQGY